MFFITKFYSSQIKRVNFRGLADETALGICKQDHDLRNYEVYFSTNDAISREESEVGV